jgi:alpha-glucuronidase
MHHVAYRYVLHSGKTVIQHIYDSHYDGAAEAQTFPEQWRQLHGRIDEERYAAVLKKLKYQGGHAVVWRDAVCNWFYRESRIPDEYNRVGRHPGRIEAEEMSLEGYKVVPVTPWEDASGGRAAVCGLEKCMAGTRFKGPSGWYNIAVQYFDTNAGVARFEVWNGAQLLEHWAADDSLPSTKLDSHSSTRHALSGVMLHSGDEIRIVGFPNDGDRAALDYLEITPEIPKMDSLP